MLKRQKFIFLTLILAWPQLTSAEWLSREESIMGTVVQVELWHDQKEQAHQAIQAVIDEMHRIDRLMSPYKPDSELSKINNLAGRQTVVISDEMMNLIQRSLQFSERTQGAFDITFASVGNLYDYRNKIKPEPSRLSNKLPAINYRHIKIDPAKKTIYFNQKYVQIDLGGIAKGYAVDRAITLLSDRGITSAIVTAGGDSRILGDKRGRPWMVGIRDPRNKQELVAALPMTDAAISTSGDYERYFESDGIRYHHIISPKTGESIRSTRSVTVIGTNTTTTDALSTSIFVLGQIKGMKLIESTPEVEAIIIDKAGIMYYSKGLQKNSH
ncbi:MAG: FAD:protein FMN transferase [Gammaproteobacteria bacterium]|nr:FAD:protein FMN transferase [Gammaproteobacteria bacterium]